MKTTDDLTATLTQALGLPHRLVNDTARHLREAKMLPKGDAPRRKVYRALGPDVVEKQFIDPSRPTPEGWFGTPQEAKEAWVEPESEKAR
jgi:hypothetical protein